MHQKCKYTLKKPYQIAYICLILFAGGLSLIRWVNAFSSIVFINEEITSHISNFALSFIIVAGAGTAWLQYGMKFRYIVGLVIVMILANVFSEMVFVSINTGDMMDLLYGIVGTLLAFAFVCATKKYGLIESNQQS